MAKLHCAVPKIRFKSFSGDWKEKKLGDIAKIYDGTHQTPNYVKNGIPFYGVEQVTSNEYNHTKFVSVEVYEKECKRVKLEKKDILMTRIGDIGTIKYIDWDVKASFYVSLALIKLKDERNTNKYIAYLLQSDSLQKELWSYSLHVAFPKKINLGDIGKCKVELPSLKEQIQIGNFFQKLDEVIELQQKRLEQVQIYKKVMLQKMFPQQSGTVPKMRFKRFGGDWKEKKLGDIAKIVGGGTPDTSNPDYWNGNINWFSPIEIGNVVYVYSSNRKITELGYKKSSARLLPAHKTILFTSRAGIGDMAILKEEASTNQGFQSLVIEEKNCNVYFIYSMGNFIKNKALKIASGSTFLEISGKALAQIKQLFPSIEEQTQIGNFFQKLDEFIEQHQTKLKNYQTLKKAMLQRLFV